MRKLNGIFSTENYYLERAVKAGISQVGNYINWLDSCCVQQADFILVTETELQRERWQTLSVEELENALGKMFIVKAGVPIGKNEWWPKELDLTLGAKENLAEVMRCLELDVWTEACNLQDFEKLVSSTVVYCQWDHKLARETVLNLVKQLKHQSSTNCLVVDLTEFAIKDSVKQDYVLSESDAASRNYSVLIKDKLRTSDEEEARSERENANFVWNKMIYWSTEHRNFPLMTAVKPIAGGYELIRRNYFYHGQWIEKQFFSWLSMQCTREEFSHLVLVIGAISPWGRKALMEADNVFVIVKGDDDDDLKYKTEQIAEMLNMQLVTENGCNNNSEDEYNLIKKERKEFNKLQERGNGILWSWIRKNTVVKMFEEGIDVHEPGPSGECALSKQLWLEKLIKWMEER